MPKRKRRLSVLTKRRISRTLRKYHKYINYHISRGLRYKQARRKWDTRHEREIIKRKRVVKRRFEPYKKYVKARFKSPPKRTIEKYAEKFRDYDLYKVYDSKLIYNLHIQLIQHEMIYNRAERIIPAEYWKNDFSKIVSAHFKRLFFNYSIRLHCHIIEYTKGGKILKEYDRSSNIYGKMTGRMLKKFIVPLIRKAGGDILHKLPHYNFKIYITGIELFGYLKK